MILFKKVNKKDLKNYTTICLLSNIYNVVTKILTKRLKKTSGYSSTDNINVVIQLKEKSREYNIPLCIAFVDNASLQTQAVLTSLQ